MTAMKVYERTENGVTTRVPLAEGLAVINYAQMDGARFVRTMSASHGDAQIEYKNGTKITLRRVEIDAPDEPAEWSGTHSNYAYLHRFDPETLRGRCNRSFRPARNADGYALKTRTEVEHSEHAHMYTFCPRCEQRESEARP